MKNNTQILDYIRSNPGKVTSQLREIFNVSGKNKASFKLKLKKMMKAGWLKQNKKKQYFYNAESTNSPLKDLEETQIKALTKEDVKAQAKAFLKGQGKASDTDSDAETSLPTASKIRKKDRHTEIHSGKLIKMKGTWSVAKSKDTIYPVKGKLRRGKTGQKVQFELFHGRNGALLAKILGFIEGEAAFDSLCHSFLRTNGLKEEYSSEIMDEAIQTSSQEIDLKGRTDFRDWETVTIDPLGARDHDDAISLSKEEDGTWKLGVHIADVSHYVAENKAIDIEALKRSFTQYLPWQAVGMLPEELSTNMCSLKEGKDRYAFSCIIQLSARGIVKDFSFVKSVVNVDRFLTYEEAFDAKKEPTFANLAQVTKYLRGRRLKSGLLELNMPESRVAFNENGEPTSIIQKDYIESQSWIEECMLLTNQCCADYLKKNKLVGLYREHERPNLEELAELLQNEPSLREGFTFNLNKLNDSLEEGTNVQPEIFQVYAKIVANAKGDLNLLRKILRSMAKANYGTEGLGHFALCWKNYAHFTSPIRRYADLWVHRRMTECLAGEKVEGLESLADNVAEQISENEIVIQKVERKAVKFCTAWMAKGFLGQDFDAEVSGLQEYGLFVAVLDPYFEGLVRYADIEGDYFDFDPIKACAYGKRSGRSLRLGDKVRVRLSRVDVERGQIDFKMYKD